MKKAHFFSHDSNARNDNKMIAVRMRHKAAGYAVYFMILERLRDEVDYMSIKDYNVLAFDFRESAEIVKSIVEDFGLFEFTDDGKKFYSVSFMDRMDKMDEQTRIFSESGKKGGGNPNFKKGESNPYYQKDKGRDKPPLCGEINKETKLKETKLKEDIPPNGGRENPPDLSPPNTKINYQEIINLFHLTCKSFPNVQKLTDPRRDKIKTRINEIRKLFPDVDYKSILKELFEKTEQSDFLRGNNKNGWKASFDWIFENGKNWVKIYEGNYENKSKEITVASLENETNRRKELFKETFK